MLKCFIYLANQKFNNILAKETIDDNWENAIKMTIEDGKWLRDIKKIKWNNKEVFWLNDSDDVTGTELLVKNCMESTDKKLEKSWPLHYAAKKGEFQVSPRL